MKRIARKIKITSLALVLVVASSCDGFLDINDSPNAVLDPPLNTLMAGSTTSLAFMMGSSLHLYSSLFVQQFTGGSGPGIQSVEYSRYNVTDTDMNNIWRSSIYGGVLADLRYMIDKAGTANPHYSGIGKLMTAMVFQVTVDAWGDVPYDESLKFLDNVKPVYESSSSIYPKLIALIDEGVAEVKQPNSANTVLPGPADLFYGGDVSKWERFGNALKLRIYIHHYPKEAATADTGIAAMLSSGALLMRDNNDNFQMAFEGSADRQNPIDQFERRRQNQFFPTSRLVSLMDGKADPRGLSYFTRPAGTAAAAPGQQATTVNFFRMHTYLRGAVNGTSVITGYVGDAPQRILTFAEQNLILAEYHVRAGNLDTAEGFFRAAITASMTAAGVGESDRLTYLATQAPANVFVNAPATAIQRIIEEKYVANYGVPMEPWTDWRRTGFPTLTPVAGAALAQIPRVFPYSDLERVTNGANTPTRTADQLILPGVFWDPGL